MKKYLIGILVVVSSIVLLQNCGEINSNSFDYKSSSLNSLYPYHAAAPSYFADVQVVDKQKISGNSGTNYSYRLIATAVSTADENSQIEVEILIMDSSETLICPRIIQTVNRATNHLEIDNCITTDDVDSIVVKVLAGPVGGELEEARSQIFDLSNL